MKPKVYEVVISDRFAPSGIIVMEKFRRFLHPVWTGFVLLIAAYVLRGVFPVRARYLFCTIGWIFCDPADF